MQEVSRGTRSNNSRSADLMHAFSVFFCPRLPVEAGEGRRKNIANHSTMH